MKRLFVPLFLLISFISKAQYTRQDTLVFNSYKAGIELRKYAQAQNLAHGLEIVGGGIAAFGATQKDDNDNKPIIYAGIGVSALGFIVELISSSHVNKAGIYLSKNGIVIPLKRKRN